LSEWIVWLYAGIVRQRSSNRCNLRVSRLVPRSSDFWQPTWNQRTWTGRCATKRLWHIKRHSAKKNAFWLMHSVPGKTHAHVCSSALLISKSVAKSGRNVSAHYARQAL